MINEVWLLTFKVLAKERHFTKTAELLNMTQPGVSQHIKKLEQSLGYPLISKIGKGFELTREGELLYDYAVKKEEHEFALFDRLSSEDENSGVIKLACSGTLAMILYPRFLERQKEFPNLSISIEAAPDYLIEKKVLNNEVDIGIITHSSPAQGLIKSKLGTEELCIVYPRGTRGFKANCLSKLRYVDHPDGKGYLKRLLQLNPQIEEKTEIETCTYINQINQILIPVSIGLGFTIMPRRFVENFSKGLRTSLLKDCHSVYDNYFLIQKDNKYLGKRYNWFLSEIEKVLR